MRSQITSISLASTASTPVTYDTFHGPFNVSLFCVVTGTVSYTVQHTGDDIFNKLPANCTWFPHDNADLVNAIANQNDNFDFPVTASRVYLNSGSGTVTLTSIQAGCAGGPT